MNKSSGAARRALRLAVLLSIALIAVAFAACAGNPVAEPTESGAMARDMPMDSDSMGDGMSMETGGHEAGDEGHGDGAVDPDAPLVEVKAFDLRFEPGSLSVMAGQPFTVLLHNEGALEHDFTIEGFEEIGAAHAQAGGEAMNTFHLEHHGEYTAYCTIPGHRAAGMEVKVVAEG